METIYNYSYVSSIGKYDINLPSTIFNYQNNNFDKHCIDTYGRKCCLLYYIDKENIEVRLLDRLFNPAYIIQKNNLYKVIPDYLSKKYTVVVVEMIESTGKNDITSIHICSNIN
jgi:hypothetical protein